MSRITWDALGERIYEIGLDHGVLYLPEDDSDDGYSVGVPWNGLTKVTDSVLNDEGSPLYYGDTVVYSEYMSGGYTGNIEALTYPDEFDRCLGIVEYYRGIELYRQYPIQFGLSYRTLIGSDAEGLDKGYKIHLLYNVRIPKFEKSYATISDSLDISAMSWEYEAFPEMMYIADVKPVYHIAINSTTTPSSVMKFLEETLYGTESSQPRLPGPDEIINEYYNHYDIWEGYPGMMIYPSSDKLPIAPAEVTGNVEN